METPIDILREDYKQTMLDIDTVDADPFRQFGHWLHQAYDAGIEEPDAMALATATPGGQPSCRIVLLRGASGGGFTFYTNFQSRKGEELQHNPHGSLLFFWPQLERQIRIEGRIEQVTEAESDAYFATRPRGSQLGAWASPQSQAIQDRAELDRRLQEAAQRFPDEVARPAHWGGYRLIPHHFEFWQGRESRLHDRIRYNRVAVGEWAIKRLAP
ncbi:MAG: Pyridoxine/pyridoxamine 5'-phosphate oxidase [Gammaproteobacteria bacterium]|nr:Pyridoxine/pyridoxamine 5'-phosphate oxidase [Gammaproteobacteria bacterium]